MVNSVPAKSCAEVLTPNTTECDLVSVERGSLWIGPEDERSGVGATPVPMVPAEETPRQWEVEAGVRNSQAAEQAGPPGAAADKEGAHPRGSGGARPCQPLGFGLSGPQCVVLLRAR